ncbi:prosaposin-like isoform X2 [Archocentrus centrarchus]|uniref:prosaposin isoform X2 n=1 Tax=Archocentrus centrarchus TaxID=63155 RepID=UPI0011EA485C|nr:prosaposin-like isoform X2 [Archocentrus centrarchus]XP_030603874.1 prosaposin-like isoform X2 [Archocentrus centrarchus]
MLLLTLLFVSSAVATPLLGTEQCARGPPYWCKNVKTASLCGAVTHCQQNVWSKPEMKSVPCDLCKEVLTVVGQILKENATEAEILGYLEKACQLLPDQGLSAECKEIVDDYYPILIGIIKGELENPAVVCGAMGLCQSQQAALAKVQKQLLSNEIPQVDLSQQALPFLLNVPGLLYPQESPEQEAPKQESPKQDSDTVCQDCIKLLTDAQAEAKANSSFIDSLIENIEKQCDLLGPGLAAQCKQYVSQYGTLVVQQLMSMQPKEICTFVGFCTETMKAIPMLTLQAAKTVSTSKVFPAAKLFPATKVDSATEKSKPMVRVRDSPTCAICEFVMKQLDSMLEDHATEEEIIQSVEKVCSILPSSLSAQCKDLIETYGQAIIDLLVQQADPKTVCTVLGLCNGQDRAYVVALDKPHFKAGGYCEVCKMAVNYIDGILEKNATEAEIEEAVRKVCNFLPDSYKTQCDQLVEQYEPILIQLLLEMLDPDFVCMKLGACPEAGRRLLGTEQCSWGPAFWCKNMETAKQCNAVAHCQRHVWV